MSIKVQQGRLNGLIKLILEDTLKKFRIPIMWSTFADMNEEDEIQANEYDRDPTVRKKREKDLKKKKEKSLKKKNLKKRMKSLKNRRQK